MNWAEESRFWVGISTFKGFICAERESVIILGSFLPDLIFHCPSNIQFSLIATLCTVRPACYAIKIGQCCLINSL